MILFLFACLLPVDMSGNKQPEKVVEKERPVQSFCMLP